MREIEPAVKLKIITPKMIICENSAEVSEK
jgi:hypothetical protein